jgi:hypothetical protein
VRLADGLLPGEDPIARSSAEARRWLDAYSQLLQDTHADGVDGPVSGPLLEVRRRHYRNRIAFWRRRLEELARREKHPAEPRPGMVRLSDVPEELKFSGEHLTGLLDGEPVLITPARAAGVDPDPVERTANAFPADPGGLALHQVQRPPPAAVGAGYSPP